jgi:hypothetical protein
MNNPAHNQLMSAPIDINAVIRANIRAKCDRSFLVNNDAGLHVFFWHICKKRPHESKCSMSLYSDGLLRRDVYCEGCYQFLLSLMPPHTSYLDRARLFAVLVRTTCIEWCLVHPERPLGMCDTYSRKCCSGCHNSHVQETAQMARRYLLAGCMGLPSELVREIIWFAVRV